jgi:hypothetical protein
MSVVPPGAAGTTMRMLWLGFHAPWAARLRGNRLAIGRTVAAASAARRESGRFIGVSSLIKFRSGFP